MVHLKYRNFKTIKLKDLVPRGKNLYRFNVFFNYQKYRRKKWIIQRSKIMNYRFYKTIIFKRFDLNQRYLFFQKNNLLNIELKPDVLKVRKFYTYKIKLKVKRRLEVFFYSLREKFIKKFIVFRRYLHRFDSFDNNLLMLLLRMGIIINPREARKFIKYYGLSLGYSYFDLEIKKLNSEHSFFEFLDYKKTLFYFFPEEMPHRPFTMAKEGQFFQPNRLFKAKFYYKTTFYEDHMEDYILKRVKLRVNLFQRALLLLLRPSMSNDLELKPIKDEENFPILAKSVTMYRNINPFISGILPMPFPINYANMSFFFLNLKIRNQWSHYIDFFMLKKFLQYRR
jgi:hypothetical protein